MKNQQFSRPTRRNVLQWIAAGASGVAASLTFGGCANSPLAVITSTVEENQHRLYLIKPVRPHELPWEAIVSEKLPQPVFIGSHGRIRVRTESDKPSYAIWATPKQAKQFSKLEGVDSIREKKAEDVTETGTSGEGDLYVELIVNNSTEYLAAKGTFASNEDVITHFTKIGSMGVEIEPVKAEGGISNGQIRVKGSDGIPERLLEAIKAHPQIIRLSWGEPFKQPGANCPACGRG